MWYVLVAYGRGAAAGYLVVVRRLFAADRIFMKARSANFHRDRVTTFEQTHEQHRGMLFDNFVIRDSIMLLELRMIIDRHVFAAS